MGLMGLMGLARSVYRFRPEGAVQLSALGNAQGKRQPIYFALKGQRSGLATGLSVGNCPALIGRRTLGSRFFPGRCPGLEAALAFQAEENSITTLMGKQRVVPCMSIA